MTSVGSVVVADSSVTIAIGSVAVGTVGTTVDSESGSVSASIVVASGVVSWLISEVFANATGSSSVTISVIGCAVVGGVVIGCAVVRRVRAGGVVTTVVESAVTTVGLSVANALNSGFNFSGSSSGDLGGGLSLGAIGRDSKKCSSEGFHCKLNLILKSTELGRLLNPRGDLRIISLSRTSVSRR